ncbi:MAG: DUF485 domain-containing protein [Methyloprofundus sp.]|nr:DUF485 domain-containing protein [Methyloprofundus sp.]
MSADLYEKINNNPKFHQLVAQRSRLAWGLSTIIFVVYFAFILLIAFAPSVLGKPIFAGSLITIGIPVGIFIIFTSFILTGIYAWKANKNFDRINQEIIAEAQQ